MKMTNNLTHMIFDDNFLIDPRTKIDVQLMCFLI